jgi:hypothetical protein
MEREFSEELKERQRYWLQHLQAAGARAVSLAEYARIEHLDSDALYRWRALFKRKGVITAKECADPAVGFSAVRVANGGTALSAVTVHVGSVLQIECASLPSPQWLAELCVRLQAAR